MKKTAYFRRILASISLQLFNPKLKKRLQEYEKISTMTVEKIKTYQQKKLKKILLHSYKNVPYYRKILAEKKVIYNGRVNLKNFNKIPYLTKEIIRKEGKNLLSEDIQKRKPYKNTSGGSTGEPVEFIQDSEYWLVNGIINKIYFNKILGKEPGELEINLWGSERDINTNTLSLKNQIINFCYNRIFLNAIKINDKNLKEFVNTINKYKPKSIWSYADSIDILAKFIKKNKLKIHSPNLIITTAGLLYPEIRKNIEETFKAPVYDQYGSREVGPIATECEYKNGYHFFPWSHFIEIINNEKIVITVLTNYSMPLIRYKIGDLGIKKTRAFCRCGRNTLFFKKIVGRESSHFINFKGDRIRGGYFYRLLYFQKWIKQFQIVQEKINLINFFIIKNSNPSKKILEDIEKKVTFVMGKNCQVNFIYKKRLKKLKSGKFLYAYSKIA